MSNNFKLSVITINCNNSHGLYKTVESVYNQRYRHLIQHILIDCGSLGKQNLSELNKRFDILISESDKGISDAFNKGLDQCTGDYILILNSGDCWYQNTSEIIFENLNKGYDGLFFNVDIHRGNRIQLYKAELEKVFKKVSCMHCGMILNRQVVKACGYYSLDFKLAMDYDYLVRFASHSKNNISINQSIAIMEDGGISSEKIFGAKFEVFKIQKRYNHLYAYKEFLYSTLKGVIRIALKKSKVNFF